MRKLSDIALPFEMPVLFWSKLYFTVAERPPHLFIESRSAFKDMEAQECHLLDANGRRFDIIGWEAIKPFGGVETFPDRLLRHIFQVPIVANERQLSLEETKCTVLHAARNRYQFDTESYALDDIEDGLPGASTHREAIMVVRKAIMPA